MSATWNSNKIFFLSQFLKAMFERKLSKISLIIFIFAVLIGSILEVIRVYALTNSFC